MNFDRILQVALAFEPSQTLFAGHRLGLFKAVDEKPLSEAELSQRCGLAPRAAVALANALVALGFMRKKDGLYSNAEDVSHFLVPGKPNFLGGVLDYEIDSVYPTWGQTIPSVRENKPVGGRSAWDYMYGDHKSCEQLKPIRHALGYLYGEGVARHSELEGVKHLLVVADAGRYLFHVLEMYPKMHITVVDGPANMDTYVREEVSRRGFTDRVTLIPCNFVEAEFPKGCDGAIISEILQNWDDETLIRIFQRARDVLPPGAPCAAPEFWINEEKTGPVGSAMHNLQMVLRSEVGFHRSDSEAFRIMEKAGFLSPKVSPRFGGQGLPMAVYRATVPA